MNERALERVVVITGGSSGIGRCTALVFARRGWKVGLIARGAAGLAASAADVRATGAACATEIADVVDSAALEQAAARIAGELGPVEVWINAAGNGVYGRLLDVPEAEYRRVTDVTYMGTVNGTRTALRRMLPRNRGSIVNVCSGVAFHGLPLMTSYSGAKAAVRGFGQSVRVELRMAKSRVQLCTVFPPAVNTPFFSHAPSHMGFPSRPVPPVYQPEIVARAILLAATGRRREMTISSIVAAFAMISRLSPTLAAWLTERLRFDAMLSRDPAARASEEPCLFAPPSRVLGMHGPFGNRARGWSAHVWLLGLGAGWFSRRPPAPRSLPGPGRAEPDPARADSDAPAAAASGRLP